MTPQEALEYLKVRSICHNEYCETYDCENCNSGKERQESIYTLQELIDENEKLKQENKFLKNMIKFHMGEENGK